MTAAAQLAYRIDTSLYPIVAFSATPLVHDLAALEATYAAFETILARNEPILLLFDLRGGTSNPARRKRFADFMAKHESKARRFVVASATVVGSQLERGFLTALLWMVRPPVPISVFTSVDDAQAWLRERYRERGSRAQRSSSSPPA